MWITRDWNYSYKSRQFFVCDRMQWNIMSLTMRHLAELHLYTCFNLIFLNIILSKQLLCFYVFMYFFLILNYLFCFAILHIDRYMYNYHFRAFLWASIKGKKILCYKGIFIVQAANKMYVNMY